MHHIPVPRNGQEMGLSYIHRHTGCYVDSYFSFDVMYCCTGYADSLYKYEMYVKRSTNVSWRRITRYAHTRYGTLSSDAHQVKTTRRSWGGCSGQHSCDADVLAEGASFLENLDRLLCPPPVEDSFFVVRIVSRWCLVSVRNMASKGATAPPYPAVLCPRQSVRTRRMWTCHS